MLEEAQSDPVAPALIKLIIRREAIRRVRAPRTTTERSPPADLSRRAYSVRRLLLDTRGDFIETTFWRLLKRAPDPAGYEYYFRRLTNGTSPVRILREISRSGEARTRGTQVRKWIRGLLLYGLSATIHGRQKLPAAQTGYKDLYLNQLRNGATSAKPLYRSPSEIDGPLADYAVATIGNRRRDQALYERSLVALTRTIHAIQSHEASGSAGARHDPGFRRSVRESTIVDVGCGLGVWLDLLAARTIPAVGIDTNFHAVGHCRSKGHEVAYANPTSYLAALAPESVATVTAFDLDVRVELEQMAAFLAAVHRALVPGGLLLVSLSRPDSAIPSGFPLPPEHFRLGEFVRFLARSTGLESEAIASDASTDHPAYPWSWWKSI